MNIRNLTQRHFKPDSETCQPFREFSLVRPSPYLRHSIAAANEHSKIVSERLGHASITLTLDTYSHVLPSMQQAASDKLADSNANESAQKGIDINCAKQLNSDWQS